MSPIVYVPHECEPPGQGKKYSSNYEGLYPEGTIWECEKCARRWELEYLVLPEGFVTFFGRYKEYIYYKINWKRVCD